MLQQLVYDACFDDPLNSNSSLPSEQFCVDYIGFHDNTLAECKGTLYEKRCTTCLYVGTGVCLDGAGGYMLDCSNVKTAYKAIAACENMKEAIVMDVLDLDSSKNNNVDLHSSKNNNVDLHSSKNNNGHNALGNALGGVIVIFALMGIAKGLKMGSRRASAPPRRQFLRLANPQTGRLEIVEMRAISQQELTVHLASRPQSAVGYETLNDPSNPTFCFSDATEKDPQTATNLRTFVNDSDWQAIRDFLQATREQNSQRRSFWMSVIQKEIAKTWSTEDQFDLNAQMSPMLDYWLQAEPENSDCRVLRLSTFTSFAWHARTSGLARSVSQQRFAAFHQRLTEAAKEFADGKTHCRDDPLFYATGMTIVLGLGKQAAPMVTMEECRYHLKHDTRDPLCYTAHTKALQNFCQKWGGSHTAMFDYAMGIVSQLPDGHPLWVLIPMAHFERNLMDQLVDRRRAAAYWQSPHVARFILGAYQRAFPGASETNVQAATAPEWSLEWTSRNYFLYCLVMTKQFEAAKKQIRLIGRRPCERPWGSLEIYKAILRQLGFDTSEPSPAPAANGGEGPDDSLPVAAATVVRASPIVGTIPLASRTIPLASAEIASIDDQDETNLPIVGVTLV